MNTQLDRSGRSDKHRSPHRAVIAGAMGLVALLATPVVSSAQTGPMGLVELARSALERNRELRVAREGYVTAQEQVSEAWSNVMPSVDFNGSYTRNISPTVNFLPAQIFDPSAGPDDYLAVQFGADNTWNSAITFEQPVFRPGVIVALGA
ncbi:MAG: TolC family protein, partial [Gemmatimonadota bacterium]|nr:TolC family protein [Gemmatimonadota bacterium]